MIRFCRLRRGAAWLCALALCGCERSGGEPPAPLRASASASAASRSSIGPPAPPPAPRQGMVWIPPGALVAGTPPNVLPRKPDEEIPGEQVILHGYYIDVFPYPNEEGAIPLTNVAKPEADALCAERDKRLCTELEWERACKGPDNHLFEYGDRHRPDRCGTGVMPSLRPAGLRVGCRSDFGVRDLHGGAFEWTASPWRRGTTGELFAVRGGNGVAGEIVARCANAEGQASSTKSGSIGFRCCAGPANSAEVDIVVEQHAKKLDLVERPDPKLAARLLAALPDEARAELKPGGAPHLERLWLWHPVGNEEILAASICSGIGFRPSCGVLLSREKFGTTEIAGWASSGFLPPSLHMEHDPGDVWLLGGDELGRFKRLMAYAWGRITVHAVDRRVGPVPKKKDKRQKR